MGELYEKELKFAQADIKSFKKPKILKRDWILIFTFFAAFIMYLLRYNLSVAIIAILDEKITINKNDVHNYKDLNYSIQTSTNISNTDVILEIKKYDFDDMIVSQILASYFYGYAIFQLPAGRFSELFGARWMLGISIIGSGLLSLITPFMFDIHYIAVCITRFLIGSLHAAILCSSFTLYSEWLPSNKQVSAIALVNCGFEIGGVVTFYLTGVVCQELHWKYAFFLFGLCSFIWCIPFFLICYSNPDSDPNLSDYEKKLVAMERKEEYAKEDFTKSNLIKIPPKLTAKILFTSLPVISSVFAKCALGYGYYVVTVKMPGYLHDIFDMGIEQTGSFTSIAEACALLSKLTCFILSGYLMKVKCISLTNIRKIFQSITMLFPACLLFIITIKNDSKDLDIFLMCLSMFFMGFVCLGDTAITSEFAKDLSGSMFGYTNMFATIQGILTPIISGYVLETFPNDKAFAWNIVFYIGIIFFILGEIIFLLFATAEPQPWAISKFVSADEIRQKKNQSNA